MPKFFSPSFLFFLAAMRALTGAIPLAFEMRTPSRGQKIVVNQERSDISLEIVTSHEVTEDNDETMNVYNMEVT